MTDLEELFQEAAALAEQAAAPAGDVMGRLRRARIVYRRRRRAMLAVPVAAVAVVAVAVAPSLVPRSGGSLVPADGGSTVASSPSPVECIASGGAVCVQVPAQSPEPGPTNAATSCSYRQTSPDATTARYRQTTAGRQVGLPPAIPGPLPTSATIHTNRGDIAITLRPETACTVNSFVHLVQHNYYDDTPCFRLTTTGIYVLQCGDPSSTGSGGPGYAYDDEQLYGTTYPAGTVAMANAGPGTNGSQFFLVYQDSQLNPDYTVFGHITAGLDVLTQIATSGNTPAGDGHPNIPVNVQSVTIG